METTRSRRFRYRQLAGTVLPLTLAFATLAQTRNSGTLPVDLKPSLDARLAQFTKAQADGRWDDVAAMLGRYRMGGVGHHPLPREAKTCLISQMKEIPMVSFVIKDYTFSTAIFGVPLDRRSWDLDGEAVFRTATGEQKSRATLNAYRDQGTWYFSPPDLDDYWLTRHLTERDFAVDRTNEIEIEDLTESPLEIADVYAHLQKHSPTLLAVSFKLKNRANKKIQSFRVRFSNKSGGVEHAAGHGLEPGQFVNENETMSRYAYFCDGAMKHKFAVVSVSFADGTEWNHPKPQ